MRLSCETSQVATILGRTYIVGMMVFKSDRISYEGVVSSNGSAGCV